MEREQIIRMAEECGIPEFENNESQAAKTSCALPPLSLLPSVRRVRS
jgi:hypothetical protein